MAKIQAVVLSDLHLGYHRSALHSNQVPVGETYASYLDKVLFGPLGGVAGRDGIEFLILAGDVLDFSLQGYAHAFENAQQFFPEVAKSGLFANIVYVAGNHDHCVAHGAARSSGH